MSPFDFMSGTSTATTLIPAVTHLDDLKVYPNVVFYDAKKNGVDYTYSAKYDRLHIYDVVYYEGGVLYHSIETMTGNTITNNPGNGWHAVNTAIGLNGTGLTLTVSAGNDTVNMVMGGFSNSHEISTDFSSNGGSGIMRTGAFKTGNYAKCFDVKFEVSGIPGGVWPEGIVPMFLRTSDYDVVVNDPQLSGNGTDIVEIVTIDGVEYYLIHDYSKVTVTPKDDDSER